MVGVVSVLFARVAARVLKVSVSLTPAKSGIVSVAPPTVCAVTVNVSVWPLATVKGEAAVKAAVAEKV